MLEGGFSEVGAEERMAGAKAEVLVKGVEGFVGIGTLCTEVLEVIAEARICSLVKCMKEQWQATNQCSPPCFSPPPPSWQIRSHSGAANHHFLPLTIKSHWQ